jgi:hypothetical protein
MLMWEGVTMGQPRTMAKRRSRHRDRAKLALVCICAACLVVPWFVGCVEIVKWVVR